AFTNRVTGVNVHNYIWTTGADYHPSAGFVRTSVPADGGIVIGPLTGVAIFNADCPCVTLYDEQDGVLAHLHAGYRCLIRENPEEPNIIEVGIREFPRYRADDAPDPARLKAVVWGGIRSCCWVPEDDKVEIRQPELAGRHEEFLRACLFRTTRSPRGSGHVSVDLYPLARMFLLQCGIPAENISEGGDEEGNPFCTCCAMENGEPQYWSHTRFQAKQQDVDGRNFSVAWLEQE
ncbi:MAG: laccase domain-containing protein, partial [bacterium]|nr:laccase domain-containing protein [bacterium]